MTKIIKILLLIIGFQILLFEFNVANCQVINAATTDTLLLSGEKDSIPDMTTHTKDYLDRLQEWSSRPHWANKFIGRIFNFDTQNQVENNLATKEEAYRKYEPWGTYVIRNIDIQVFDPLGYNLNEIKKVPRGRLERLANNLHVSTRTWVIRKQLLFEPGQKINPFLISEAERLLRRRDYVYDASINLRRVKGNRDSIDVVVRVQDVWSLNMGVSGDVAGSITADVSGNESNFLGFGNSLDFRVRNSNEGSLPVYPNVGYTINNLGTSLATLRASLTTSPTQTVFFTGVNRDFISPAIRTMGGANFLSNAVITNNISDSSQFINETYLQDLWAGYATDFKGNKNPSAFKHFVFSGRVAGYYFGNKPIVDVFGLYKDKVQFFGAVSYVERRFYKDHFIFGFGKTEDVPTGFMAQAISGISYNGTRNLPYIALRSSWSRFRYSKGFFNTTAELGGYQKDHNIQQMVFKWSMLYYTPLTSFNGWNIRFFVWHRFGLNSGLLASGSTLSLGNLDGLRGLSVVASGIRKEVINAEIDLYPPVKLVGFKFAFIGFADLGFAWLNRFNFKESSYTGFGLGIRIKNENLVFPTFQLLLGFYPRGLDDGSRITYSTSRSSFFSYDQLIISRPGEISGF